MALIELRNISKIYGCGDGKVEALKDISIAIDRGEMASIMGPSGSGKSTLINIIGCLDTPTSGQYYINNQMVNNLRDKKLAKLRNKTFGFIVQYFALLEDYNVQENVLLPLEYTKMKRKDKYQRVKDLLKELNVEEKIDKYPKELSGGQCQRIAIARALANDPDIILADEPTGALDSKTGQEVMRIFKELNNNGKTIVIITHDINIAKMCDRIINIEDGLIRERII